GGGGPETAGGPLTDAALETVGGLRVGGAFGARPTIVFPRGGPAAGPLTDQLTGGTGAALKEGDLAIVQYTAHVWDGRGNRLADSTFNRGAPAALPVGRLTPVLDRALTGRRVGSRIIAAVPPGHGPGAHPSHTPRPGNGPATGPSRGSRRGDGLVYVVDILGAHPEGEPVPGRGGALAGVRVTGGARPELSIPRSAPPARFVSEVLSEGAGPRTRVGGLLVAQYTGAVWKRGRVFDTTWSTGQPRAFTLGDGGVIKGWDRALAGVPVGSRVLMVVPPSHGYGPTGRRALGVLPADTLVFVIDVIAAY
ncbi:FKBP-type peptidyl-prolyl cis-trans isomerase, partial [Nonomuraea lactucae]|uniref:FKBP-type peptidyl-prolyl cis-trans isomerase n=1 Tax=Nonomuraea lactucae TaxID=2249762 RepID=UPI000DE50B5A